MLSRTMKYVMAMTYRWALGWGRHACDALSYLCAYWEVRLAGMGLYTDHKGVSDSVLW